MSDSELFLRGYRDGFDGCKRIAARRLSTSDQYTAGHELGQTERMAYDARQRSRLMNSESLILPAELEE